jgi:hypothetical protein
MAPARVYARAELRGIITGSGFQDPRATEPVGGNPGTTLGEQRRRAVEHAFSLWSARLDSKVPIEIAFEFEAFGCKNGSTVLGGASAAGAFGDFPAAQSGLVYVSALANSRAGRDLDPQEPDIIAHFNSSVDRECQTATGGFYYGFDGKAGEAIDFVQVVLHELAHGLGITSLIDLDTGESIIPDAVDSFSARIRDLDLDKPWSALTAAERRASATRVRRIVWDGPEATRLAADAFASDAPTLQLEPLLERYSGAVSDAVFARRSSQDPLHGEVVHSIDCEPTSVSKQTFLLFPADCDPHASALAAQRAGALGALLVESWPFDTPAMPIELEKGFTGELEVLDFPVLSVPKADALLMRRHLERSALTAALATQSMARFGADLNHRPMLFASQPVSRGSTISHLEQFARPNQLMEPFAASEPTHGLGFTMALLKDIGWPLLCGNGRTDAGEECDEGERNSDTAADACRSDCRLARCGDGVRDRKEECDDIKGNDDAAPNSCRSTCKRAACGDGVVDRGEQCDRGAANSDAMPNACRTACKLPHCGDGVIDALEDCDDGANNSDQHAGACRPTCRAARCGDGVVDAEERCDDGRDNDPTRPNACRPTCVPAYCGDGVVDDGEECDSSADCSPDCALRAPANRDETTDSARGAAGVGTQQSAVREAESSAPSAPPRSNGCGAVQGDALNTLDGLWLLIMGALFHRGRTRPRGAEAPS